MPNDLMIETQKISKHFGSFTAVNELDLSIEHGAIHGFIGPNGAGKSTTIKMLIGGLHTSSGKGFIKGHPIGSVAAKRLIGYSPEHPAFYGDMSALDYVTYMAQVSGVKGKVRKKCADILDWLELDKFLDKKVGGFSAGMRQRVGLAQALIHNPELLILDEPTANLDPTGRMSILSKLKEVSQDRGVTIFISSHILAELEQLVTSVTLINKGTLLAEDTMSNLKKSYTKDRYILKTSDNEATMKALKGSSTSLITESWADNEGYVHLVSEDGVALKKGVVATLARIGALLEHFSAEEVTLEAIYRKKMGLEDEL